ncbi:hypothetical protein QBC46DRAFT_411058 [Diplogelasinospora grovesii]|uniref:Uncharacterized protein n=1 Tax=Diplogelasinospora grovesii TaxID=303347 RepID=A0AAN6N4D2_9PEZI|nr:hypothetical protein QBC46DRAFT_411058 [Diplogelasinospora grovesii]
MKLPPSASNSVESFKRDIATFWRSILYDIMKLIHQPQRRKTTPNTRPRMSEYYPEFLDWELRAAGKKLSTGESLQHKLDVLQELVAFVEHAEHVDMQLRTAPALEFPAGSTPVGLQLQQQLPQLQAQAAQTQQLQVLHVQLLVLVVLPLLVLIAASHVAVLAALAKRGKPRTSGSDSAAPGPAGSTPPTPRTGPLPDLPDEEQSRGRQRNRRLSRTPSASSGSRSSWNIESSYTAARGGQSLSSSRSDSSSPPSSSSGRGDDENSLPSESGTGGRVKNDDPKQQDDDHDKLAELAQQVAELRRLVEVEAYYRKQRDAWPDDTYMFQGQ